MAGEADKFETVDPLEGAAAEPGDMLGFKVGSQVAHAGVMLGGGWFVHAIRHYGVQLRGLTIPTYRRRLVVIWRPRGIFQ